MLIYHKVGPYYGVLINGYTVFSGSHAACIDYLRLFAS